VGVILYGFGLTLLVFLHFHYKDISSKQKTFKENSVLLPPHLDLLEDLNTETEYAFEPQEGDGGWTPVFCAWQDELCLIQQDQYPVFARFGSGRHYTRSKYFAKSFMCRLSEFGPHEQDPNPGFFKHCMVFRAVSFRNNTVRGDQIKPNNLIGNCYVNDKNINNNNDIDNNNNNNNNNNKKTMDHSLTFNNSNSNKEDEEDETSDKEDKQKVLRLLEALHSRPCHPSTTRIRTSGARVKGGFGNILLYQLAFFHQAVLNDESFVFDDRMEKWPTSMHTLIRSSSCQTLYMTSPHLFQHKRRGEIDGHVVIRHHEFTHRPLIWWFQQLAHFLFLEQEQTSRVIVDVHDQPIVLVSDAKQNNKKWIAVHVRHGDSCTTTKINQQRPPCMPVAKYAVFIQQYMDDTFAHSQQHYDYAVLLASDDETVHRELQYLVDIPVYANKIDRSIYRPVGDLKIEDFALEEQKIQMLDDFNADVQLLSSANVIIGQFYSSMLNLILFRGSMSEYIAVDHALPCVRGGCPSEFAPPGIDCPQAAGFYPGVCPVACRDSMACVPTLLWEYLEVFQRENLSCQSLKQLASVGKHQPVCTKLKQQNNKHVDGYSCFF
jgi:hypothetical protein